MDIEKLENRYARIIDTNEEKELIKRFGADYEDYKNNASMLIPIFTPYDK